MWIVKLGGSLAGQSHLRSWLKRLAEPADRPRLVVPGGGSFADAVRAAEPIMGYDALAAHRMAILAMQQMAMAFISLEPRLVPVETPAQMRALGKDRAGIWLPWPLIGGEPSIEPSWTVTSDSLALWLAAYLDAEDLILVKSAALPKGPLDASSPLLKDLLDEAFAPAASGYRGRIHLLPAPWQGELSQPLQGGCRLQS